MSNNILVITKNKHKVLIDPEELKIYRCNKIIYCEDEKSLVNNIKNYSFDICVLDMFTTGVDVWHTKFKDMVEMCKPKLILLTQKHSNFIPQGCNKYVYKYINQPFSTTELHTAIKDGLQNIKFENETKKVYQKKELFKQKIENNFSELFNDDSRYKNLFNDLLDTRFQNELSLRKARMSLNTAVKELIA